MTEKNYRIITALPQIYKERPCTLLSLSGERILVRQNGPIGKSNKLFGSSGLRDFIWRPLRGSTIKVLYCIRAAGHKHWRPDSKVHGANMGPPGSCRPQMGSMLAPWTSSGGCLAAFKVTLVAVTINDIRPKLLTHWGRDNMAAISQPTLSNAFSWMKM